MKAGQIVALIIVAGAIALALGATIGYSLSSGRTFTITQTGKVTTTTQNYTITTSVFLGNSSTTTNSVSPTTTVWCCASTQETSFYSITTASNSVTTSIVGSQTYITFYETVSGCCNNTSGVTPFTYPISVNYSGSWKLAYWVQDVNGIEENLNGSANSEIWITFNVAGVVQDTLCANATKLDSSQNNLTLVVLTATKSTTAASIEVCVTMAV